MSNSETRHGFMGALRGSRTPRREVHARQEEGLRVQREPRRQNADDKVWIPTSTRIQIIPIDPVEPTDPDEIIVTPPPTGGGPLGAP